MSHLLAGDADWRSDKILIGELSDVNMRIARYILRYLDADAGRKEPTGVEEEHGLGAQLVRLGEALQARAECRVAENGDAGHPPAQASNERTDTGQVR